MGTGFRGGSDGEITDRAQSLCDSMDGLLLSDSAKSLPALDKDLPVSRQKMCSFCLCTYSGLPTAVTNVVRTVFDDAGHSRHCCQKLLHLTISPI